MTEIYLHIDARMDRYELRLAVERARKRRVAALMSATPGMSETKALEAPVAATPPPPMEYGLFPDNP